MGISKNNPNVRSNTKLFVYCPLCESPMNVVQRVPGGMKYICPKDKSDYPLYKGSYKSMNYKWVTVK